MPIELSDGCKLQVTRIAEAIRDMPAFPHHPYLAKRFGRDDTCGVDMTLGEFLYNTDAADKANDLIWRAAIVAYQAAATSAAGSHPEKR